MYAKYFYSSGAAQADVLADMAAILTGETDPGNLSDACDKASTTITADVPAGWTMHDADAGSGKVVLKAPHADNAASFKHLMPDHSNSSYMQFFGYEMWDEAAHAGTNPTSNSLSSYYQRKNTSGAGMFHIFSSERFAAFVCDYGAYWGDSSYGGLTILAEHSRILPWSTSTNNMPSFGLIFTGPCLYTSNNYHVYMPRAVKNDGAVLTDNDARCYLCSIGVHYTGWSGAQYFPQGADQKIPDGLGSDFVPRMPVYLYRPDVFGAPIGDISSISNIWIAPKNLLGNLETVTVGANEYLAVKGYVNSGNDQGMRFLFRNG
ncbi:MAG: hypothetical protein GY862_17940 [Gammaproteobacteria bacterium]|nr:hypothetical protein [Gammaproteobacteria bacterium]